jgi:hypothetical protein
LHGATPKDQAPNLFKMTRFKNRTVHCELHNNNWIRNLQNINTTTQLEEFTLLFMLVSRGVLTNKKDEIFWKWTRDDLYSISLAYECPFLGAMTRFPATTLWQAMIEPKCKLFAWWFYMTRP